MNIERTLSSIEVAEMVEKPHNDLLKDIRRYLEQLAEGKIPHGDFFEESTYKDGNNQNRPCYKVTKKGCEFIAHKLTGAKGTAFTAKYINRFHDMEAYIREQNSSYNLPQTYKEALYQLVAQVEKNERLAIENCEMKPKADYFDALVDKKLNTNVRNTAKELGVKQREFVKFLLEEKYVFRQGSKGELRPYAQYSESGNGLFVLKDKQNESSGWAGQQMYITPKGKETFRLLLLNGD